jgi:hypothetical protein
MKAMAKHRTHSIEFKRQIAGFEATSAVPPSATELKSR